MMQIDHMDRARIALGRVPGVRPIDVVFRNPTIDPGTVPEHISPIGGMVALRTAAAAVEVVSSAVADDGNPGGTGARTVRVAGLDANYVEIYEDFVLDGTTAVVGSKLFLRINTVVVTSAGTGLTNAGNITVRDVGAGTTRSYIAANRGVSEVGVFTVPAGHTLIAHGWLLASRDATGNSSADIEFWTTKDGVRKIAWMSIVTGTINVDFTNPHAFEAKTDIELVVTRVLGAGTIVSYHGHGFLVSNNADA